MSPAADRLREAGAQWRAFDLENTRKQADEAFINGLKVKDEMRKRLGDE
ncbi:MAG: hypothetical protein J2P52_00295 [Blastocatellia bacterium]|nr:hypothetical protein [Blastocatellia bacterium]